MLEATHLSLKVQVITGLHGCRGVLFFMGAAILPFFTRKIPVPLHPFRLKRRFLQISLAESCRIQYNRKVRISVFHKTLHLTT